MRISLWEMVGIGSLNAWRPSNPLREARRNTVWVDILIAGGMKGNFKEGEWEELRELEFRV